MSSVTSSAAGFSVGGVIRRGWAMIREDAVLLIAANLVLAGGPAALTAVLNPVAGGAASAPWQAQFSALALATVTGCLAQALTLHLTKARLSGGPIVLRDMLGLSLRSTLPLFGLSILTGLGIGLGFILLVAPGLILAAMWCVASAVLVMERAGISDSLQRSAKLTKGHRWAIVGLLALLFVPLLSLAIAAGYLASISPFAGPMGMLTEVVLATAQSLFTTVGVVALYVELRNAREGFSLDGVASVFA